MYKELFKEVFQGTEGYVPVCLFSEEPVPTTWWYPVKALVRDDVQLPVDDSTLLQVYFTPHTFKTSDSRRKDNVSEFGSCVWMESDDEYFNPETIRQAKPSAIVRTSPGRHHLYWFLAEPVPLVEIEAVNKSLTYEYLTRDLSGWDLTQLLRVPGFVNRKRAVEFEVEVRELHPDRRYDFYEVFGESRTAVPVETYHGNRDPEFQLPGNLPNYADIYAANAAHFRSRFLQALTRLASDRSRELWYMHNECIRMDLSPSETYVLVKDSPNNKFNDNLYSAEKELWADINAAFRMRLKKDSEPYAQQLEELRQSEFKSDAKKQKISELVREDMTSRGRFYYCEDTKQVFYETDKSILNVGSRNTEFKSFLDNMYDVNPMAQEALYVVNHLVDSAVAHGTRIKLYNVSHLDEDSMVLYVSNNAGGMFRLDGNTIELVSTGVDGIMFLPNSQSDTIEPLAPEAGHSPLDYIFSLPNFSCDQLNITDTKFLIRAWLYSTFLITQGKGVLVMEGSPGSGKTTMFKCLKWLLVGEKSDVGEMPENSTLLKEAAVTSTTCS